MCLHVKFEDGTAAVICGIRSIKKFCACGRAGDLLCDWKVKGKKSGTCDHPICRRCALEVGPDKHLCREHQKAFESWKHRHPEGIAREPQPEQLSLL